MEFFYPNFINDFWRVMGWIHFGDPRWFEVRSGRKAFDRERIVAFCEERGLAFFDTATVVRRLKDNASDAFLEILEPTDVGALLARMPLCRRIVTTGGKASGELASILEVAGAEEIPDQVRNDKKNVRIELPPVGGKVTLQAWGRSLEWWRMPSTSRAYPLSLEKKAAAYRQLF